MEEKIRVYLVGLKSEADIEVLVRKLSTFKDVSDEGRARELLAQMPALVAEPEDVDSAEEIKSGLEQLGAVASIKVSKPPQRQLANPASPSRPFVPTELTLQTLPELEPSSNSAYKVVKYISIIVLALLMLNATLLIKFSGKQNQKRRAIENRATIEMDGLDNDDEDNGYTGLRIDQLTEEITSSMEIQELMSPPTLLDNTEGDIATAYDLFNQGKFDEAEKAFRELYAQYPTEDIVARGLANSLVAAAWNQFREKEFERSLEYIEEANAVSPRDPRIIKLMGYCNYKLELYRDAAGLLEQSIEMGDDDPNSHLMLAHIFYFNKDNLPKVIEHLGVASEAMPERADIRKFLLKVMREAGVEGNFSKQESRHFNVKYSGFEDEEISITILNLLSDVYVRVGYEMDYYPSDEITVILYTKKDFRSTTGTPSWSGALYDGRIKLPVAGLEDVNDDELLSLVVHEYTHAAIHRMGKAGCPTWLNEGLAMYMEEKIAGRYREAPENMSIIPLYNLHGSFLKMPADMAKDVYALSLLGTRYLIDNWGIYGARELVKRVGRGESFDKAIHDITGIPYAEFNARFKATLQ